MVLHPPAWDGPASTVVIMVDNHWSMMVIGDSSIILVASSLKIAAAFEHLLIALEVASSAVQDGKDNSFVDNSPTQKSKL